MSGRRNGRVAKLACSAALVLALSGCVQATRHSNTMVFGTNTSFGIKVGTDVAQVPGIQVGYNRQEAVILPLLANTSQSHAAGVDGTPLNRLVPCPVPDIILSGGQTHACQFVAVRGDARDSYSTLASFGAEFGGQQGTGLSAQGGLAQYFATGMSAQLLAATGGASVVNANGNPPSDGGAAAANALFGTAADADASARRVSSYNALRSQISAKIAEASDKPTMLQKLGAFETAIAPTAPPSNDLSNYCGSQDLTPTQCAAALDGPLGSIFYRAFTAAGGPARIQQALQAWQN